MISLGDYQLAAFDVDDTLVYWNKTDLQRGVDIECRGHLIKNARINWANLEQLKKHKARGATIILWSKGGCAWAEAVAKALKIEDYVDVVLPKPLWYYDDLKVELWKMEHRYLGFNPRDEDGEY